MQHTMMILGVVVVALAFSSLFSGMEAGVLALNRLRIRQLMRAGNKRAQVLHGYLESPENFLWTILVGNTLANIAAVGLLLTLLNGWLERSPALLLVSFLAVIFLFYALFELLPKMLFRLFPNRLSLMLAVPFRLIHLVLSPLVWLVTKLAGGLSRWTGGRSFTGHLFGSREEMRLFMQESAQGLTSEERLLINRVLDLQNRTVRDVMIPMAASVTVDDDTVMGEVLERSRAKQVARVPVWRVSSGQRRVAGIVSLRSVLYRAELNPAKPARDYVTPALYPGEDLRLEEALKRMRRSGQRLAIVLGQDQHEGGIVALQDILEAIFGEVRL